ncbi:hypothetical protein INR49_010474 [Caranx melampygus]|nr:hypothetical protein INR49_010474 [Caranx melampygus]
MKTGEDVHLQLKEADDVPEDFVIVQWRFNGSVILVSFLPAGEPRVSDRYRGRVDVSVGNFSVKLKNLQKSDSGVYTARIAELNKDQIVAEYKVTVEDPVSPVNLTVDSVTNSKDSCDLTVTCRSLHSHQISINTTVTCDTTTCSQQGGERSKVTASGASLHVYLKNYKIICNHSNHVLIDLAGRDQHPTNGTSGPSPVSTYDSVGLHNGPISTETRGNSLPESLYAEAEIAQSPELSPTNGPPSSIYSLIGPHTGPSASAETRGTSPESLYSSGPELRRLCL